MKKILQLSIASVVATAAMQTPASAQTSTAASNTLEEIVVTAQKREESAQKTSVSMNVYTAPEIIQKGVVDLQTLTQTDTSLVFNRNGGEATLALRGVSNTVTTELGNPSVPVAVDGFFVNRAFALDSSLFDIERIEVLRGPQGTLFGRSSTGGLVNITTAKPTKDLAASASLEYGNYAALNIGGMLNIPVNDWLQLRGAVSSRKHDPYVHNTYQPPGSQPDGADDEDSQSGRITAAFQPGDHFHGWISYQLQKQGGSGAAIESILFNPSPDPNKPGDISHSKPNMGDPGAFPMYGTPWRRVTDKAFKWEFVYDGLPGRTSLTYVGGADSYDWRHSTSTITFFGDPTAANDFLPIRPFVQHEAPKTQNHELRLTSAADGFFTWQAGLYYFHETNSLQSAGIREPGTPNAVELLTFVYDVDTKSKAAYGQGALHFTDNSKLTLGVRYSKDEVSRAGLFALPVFGLGPFPNGIGAYSSNKLTWHVGYDWTPTPTNLVYAKVDTGYKPGGFEACGNYDPENVTSGEIGSKNRFANETLQLNAAVFYTQYKDQQVQQFVSSCLNGSKTTNAGKSKIYGIEADLKALVDTVGTFDLGLSYLHATYDQFLIPPTIGPAGLASCAVPVPGPTGTNCDLSGNTLIASPKLTLAAGFEHGWELPGGTLNFRVEGRYTGKQYFDPFNFDDTEQDAYTLFNAFVNFKHENWKVGVFGRNLGDKHFLNSAAEQTAGGAHQYDYSWGTPRTFGVRFEVNTK